MTSIRPALDGGSRTPTDSDLADQLHAMKYWFLGLSDHYFSPHLAIHHAMVGAGYTSISIERLSTHPVWQICATLPPDAPVSNRRLMKRQFRALLKSAHMPVKSDEIIIMPAGRRLHVSFVQSAGRGVMMSRGVATLVENHDPEPVVEYDE